MRDTDDVREALERLLGGPIEALERYPYAYGTSFAIEALEVRTAGAATRRLLLKHPGSASESARSVKPAFLQDPLREIAVYQEILAEHDLGTPHCYGSVIDPGRGRYWLFIEHVPGLELWQIGDASVWQQAARWLAELHAVSSDVSHARLIRCDRTYFERWLARAQAATAEPRLEAIGSAYGSVVDRLLALPTSLIHGEFYPSNVLIERLDDHLRVCPVDWEMAARGPGLLDLAALTTGGWTGDQRREIVGAYHDALTAPFALDDMLEAIECCRLHIALQWLGWSTDWTPPSEHSQDWMEVAVSAADQLGIG